MAFSLLLRDGQIAAIVDDDLPAYLSQWQWSWHEQLGVIRYDAERYDADTQRTPQVILHRLITRAPDELVVHHVDGDRLNHQRVNLLLVDHAAHMQRIQQPRGRSRYLGVVERQDARGWTAQAALGGERQQNLGTYKTEEEAAKAYDVAVLECYGPAARTNFPKSFFVCPGCHRAFVTLRDAPFHNSICRAKFDLQRW